MTISYFRPSQNHSKMCIWQKLGFLLTMIVYESMCGTCVTMSDIKQVWNLTNIELLCYTKSVCYRFLIRIKTECNFPFLYRSVLISLFLEWWFSTLNYAALSHRKFLNAIRCQRHDVVLTALANSFLFCNTFAAKFHLLISTTPPGRYGLEDVASVDPAAVVAVSRVWGCRF